MKKFALFLTLCSTASGWVISTNGVLDFQQATGAVRHASRWTPPDDPWRLTSLGGGISWNTTDHFCTTMLSRFAYETVTCDGLRAAAQRGFDAWAVNSNMIVWKDVSGTGQAAEVPISSAPSKQGTATFGAPAGWAAFEHKRPVDIASGRSFVLGTQGISMTAGGSTVLGSSIVFNEDICWFLDGSFCNAFWDIFPEGNGIAFKIAQYSILGVWGLACSLLLCQIGTVCCLKDEGGSGCCVLDPCARCYDFESTVAHEAGHVLGFGHPDQGGHQNWKLPAEWDCLSNEVTSSGTTGPTEGVVETPDVHQDSIMASIHNKRRGVSCLTQDDVDGLSFLYPPFEAAPNAKGSGKPVCPSVPTTPVCNNDLQRGNGQLRLYAVVLIPFVVFTLMTNCFIAFARWLRRPELKKAIADLERMQDKQEVDGFLRLYANWSSVGDWSKLGSPRRGTTLPNKVSEKREVAGEKGDDAGGGQDVREITSAFKTVSGDVNACLNVTQVSQVLSILKDKKLLNVNVPAADLERLVDAFAEFKDSHLLFDEFVSFFKALNSAAVRKRANINEVESSQVAMLSPRVSPQARIDQYNVSKAVHPTVLRPAQHMENRQMVNVFNVFADMSSDTSNTGQERQLDKACLCRGLNHFGYDIDGKHIDQLFAELDVDNDGCISFAEFQKLYEIWFVEKGTKGKELVGGEEEDVKAESKVQIDKNPMTAPRQPGIRPPVIKRLPSAHTTVRDPEREAVHATFLRAAPEGTLKHLDVSAVLVDLGFNVDVGTMDKMWDMFEVDPDTLITFGDFELLYLDMFAKETPDDSSLPRALRREKDLLRRTADGGYTHKFLKKNKIAKAIRGRLATETGRATDPAISLGESCPVAKFVKKTEDLYQGVRPNGRQLNLNDANSDSDEELVEPQEPVAGLIQRTRSGSTLMTGSNKHGAIMPRSRPAQSNTATDADGNTVIVNV